jgi:hypothetical protein
VADNILLINAATKQTLGFQSLGSTQEASLNNLHYLS